MPTFAETYKALFKGEPPPLSNDRLKRFWDLPVSRLCELDDEDRWSGAEAWNERHRLYARLLMAIVHRYWNGWKRGRPEDPARQYPWNDRPAPGDRHLDGDYYGHNIAALAVDQKGYVLDFDFNHNELFSASTEHAEARLVRRLFGLAQVSASWGALPTKASTRRSGSPFGVQRTMVGRAHRSSAPGAHGGSFASTASCRWSRSCATRRSGLSQAHSRMPRCWARPGTSWNTPPAPGDAARRTTSEQWKP